MGAHSGGVHSAGVSGAAAHGLGLERGHEQRGARSASNMHGVRRARHWARTALKVNGPSIYHERFKALIKVQNVRGQGPQPFMDR